MLCSGAVQYLLQHETHNQTRLVSIQSEEGRALCRAKGLDPDDPTTFLWIENGRAYAASDGVLQLLRHLKGPARLLLIGRMLPRPVRDWLYYIVARNRYKWFGKSETCMVPDPATRQRFVLPNFP
jgi:predicted DCC family thiol-disulfide oxidoreductase YuxK